MDIDQCYKELNEALSTAQHAADLLKQEISALGEHYPQFERTFIGGSLSDEIASFSEKISRETQAFQQSMGKKIDKLSKRSDFGELLKEKDLLSSSSIRLIALLSKAEACGAKQLSEQLLHDDASKAIEKYNQKVHALSYSAANPEEFRRTFMLHSQQQLKKATRTIKQGDIITIGTYPQTKSGNDRTPIKWQVLDVRDNRAFVISKYGLDAKPYNTQFTGITWEKCTLRTWLNNDFYNKAFSKTEQSAILTTTVDNSKSQGYSGWSTSGGNNTQDKIFLLSYAETNKYFGVTWEDDNNTKSRVQPTAYANTQGAYTNSYYTTSDGAAAGFWWLRSPGHNQNYAARVNAGGSLYTYSVNDDNIAVRPALWVNLESGIF